MQLLPKSPRERVAVGVAMATAGVLIGLVAQQALQAFAAGGLVGWGGTVAVAALLRLRREAKLQKLQKAVLRK